MRLPASPVARRAVAVMLLIAPLGMGACAMTFDARSLGAKTTVAEPVADQPQGPTFRISRKAVFGLWGVATVSRPDLERILAGQVTGAQSIANLRITVKSGFGDVLATVLTGGLIIPRTVVYEGVIVPADTTASR